MKKLNVLGGAFLAFAMLGSFSVHAQTKTYVSENFEKNPLDPTVWNLDASTNISEQVGPTYFLQDQTTTWGGWIYDPNGQIVQGGIPTTLDGTYSLVTMPVALDSEVANIFTIDVLYSTAKENKDRKLEIKVREKDGEWETIEELSDMGFDWSGKLSVLLDEKWAEASQVELAISFTNVHKAGEPFFCFIDNILLASYPVETSVKTEIMSKPYADYGTAFDMALRISNLGTVAVDSMQYAYIVNGKNVRTVEQMVFEPVLGPLVGVENLTLALDEQDVEIGVNELKLWPVHINGKAENADTIEWTFSLVDGDVLSQTYTPVMECFTSATCGPCATMNRYLTPALDEMAGKINVIKYQMNFPGAGDRYYIAENRTRMVYYDGIFGWGGSWGVPSPIYNGEANIMDFPGTTYNDLMNLLKEKVEAANQRKAYMDMTIKDATVTTSMGKLTLELEVVPHLDIKANVIVAVLEKQTVKNIGGNGEREFFHVNMAMPASANGEKVEFELGKAQTFTYEVADMNKTHMEEITDLEVVCFVQDPSNGYIFQSVKSDVGTIVANEKNTILSDVKLYPNPAADQVTLTGLNNAGIEIYDLTGRRVYEKQGVNAQLELSLSAFAEGTYVVRIAQDGQVANRKLIVVK